MQQYAPSVYGCRESCVDYCTKSGYYNMHDVDNCVMGCDCNPLEGIFDLQVGQVNTALIAKFAENKPRGSAYYDEYFPF